MLTQEQRQQLDQRYERVKRLAAGRELSLFQVMDACTEEEAICMQFLFAYMPISDLANYDGELLLKFVKHALRVRQMMPWGLELDDEVFLNYVLPYRINSENVEFYSEAFFNEIFPRINGLDLYKAIVTVNYWCLEKAAHQSADRRTASPLTVIKNAYGCCREKSALAVAALRSVGIPARQIYVPCSTHGDDNHAWVGVLVDGNWMYLGACEPEPRLSTGRFRLTGQPMSNVTERFEIVNYAALFPLGTPSSDELADQVVTVAPPVGEITEELPLTEAEEQAHAARYEASVRMRQAYEATFYDEERAITYAKQYPCKQDEIAKLLVKARGNYEEIIYFLEDQVTVEQLELKVDLLLTLSKKDLTDMTKKVLMDHLLGALPYAKDMDAKLYQDYVLCPRVADEALTAYRASLVQQFTKQQLQDFRTDPQAIYAYVEANVQLMDEMDDASLSASPAGLLELGAGSERSKAICCVSLMRTLGIPAKLEKADGAVEFYAEGAWHTAPERYCVITANLRADDTLME